jgi:hypothetical protein
MTMLPNPAGDPCRARLLQTAARSDHVIAGVQRCSIIGVTTAKLTATLDAYRNRDAAVATPELRDP